MKKLQFADLLSRSSSVLSQGLLYLSFDLREPATHIWTKMTMKMAKVTRLRKKYKTYLRGSTLCLYWAIAASFANSFSIRMQLVSNSCCWTVVLRCSLK